LILSKPEDNANHNKNLNFYQEDLVTSKKIIKQHTHDKTVNFLSISINLFMLKM